MSRLQRDTEGAFIFGTHGNVSTEFRVVPQDAYGPARLNVNGNEYAISLNKLSELFKANGFFRLRRLSEVFGEAGPQKPVVGDGLLAIDRGQGRAAKARVDEVVEALREVGFIIAHKDDEATKRLFAAIRRQTVEERSADEPNGPTEDALMRLGGAVINQSWERAKELYPSLCNAMADDSGELARAAQAVFGVDFTKAEGTEST